MFCSNLKFLALDFPDVIHLRMTKGEVLEPKERSSLMRPATKSPIRILSKLFLFIFVLGVGLSSAQSLDELARQQRARKQGRSAQPPRVYTNEDLARPQILDLADRRRNEDAAPAVASGAGADKTSGVQPWPAAMPLGDVARFYRQLKKRASSPEGENGTQQARESQAPWLPIPAQRNANSLRPALQRDDAVGARKAATNAPLPTPRQVRVRPGDSLWRLARRHLGNANEWRKIAALNPEIADPNLLRVGQQLRLPGESAPAVAKQVRVKAGDSLWKLAQVQWGAGQAWSCIVEANPQITEANRIFPGQVLTLPPTCAPIA